MSNVPPPDPSQPGPPPGAPPPPGGEVPQYAAAPPPAPGAPPPPGAYGTPGAPPPGYVPAGGQGMVRGPRPDVKPAGILVVAGALITVIAVFLPWVSGNGASLNGMDILTDGTELYDGPGQINLVLGLVLAGLGIPLIIAGRVLAVAIIAIVVAALAALMGLGLAGFAAETADLSSDGSVAIGAILQPIAPLISLGGAIWATAKRRKMVPATGTYGGY